MIKRYCDCCGYEITYANRVDGERNRIKGEVRRKGGPVLLRVEVITAKDSTWNDGDFCKYCVLDAIIQADNRPKEEGGSYERD